MTKWTSRYISILLLSYLLMFDAFYCMIVNCKLFAICNHKKIKIFTIPATMLLPIMIFMLLLLILLLILEINRFYARYMKLIANYWVGRKRHQDFSWGDFNCKDNYYVITFCVDLPDFSQTRYYQIQILLDKESNDIVYIIFLLSSVKQLL